MLISRRMPHPRHAHPQERHRGGDGDDPRLRMPYLRSAAVDVVPTARAQRWDPAELLRVLLTESHRPRPSHVADAAAVGERPAGETRGLRRATLLHPVPDPAGTEHSEVGRPAREPVRLRAIRHGQEPLLRSPWPADHRLGHTLTYFGMEEPGRPRPPTPGRRLDNKAVRRITTSI